MLLCLCSIIVGGSLSLPYYAAAFRLLLNRCLCLHSGQFGVDKDTPAVFADDDLLMHLDVELPLRWNLVEATTTSITLHINDTQTVASVLADTLE